MLISIFITLQKDLNQKNLSNLFEIEILVIFKGLVGRIFNHKEFIAIPDFF